MSAQGKLRKIEGGRVAFFCPGCNGYHQVRIENERYNSSFWTFNGDYEKPTFSPSILVNWCEPSDVEGEFDDPTKDKKMVCHSFVNNGKIQFLNDCTHSLAGQTVEIPDAKESE